MNRILNRIEEARKEDKLPVKYDDRGSVRELFCKGCGSKIAGMIISDEEPKHVAIGDKLVAVTPVEFSHLSQYAEGTIEFDDGSAHVTNGCKKCIGGLKKMENSKEVLQNWYILDVAVWMKEISLTGGGRISGSMINRTPMRIV